MVALDVGLLVDRELDVAVLDALGGVGVEVEGDELRVTAGGLDRLERVERDRGAQRDDVVDRVVLGQLGLERGDDCRVVRAVDLDVLGAPRPWPSHPAHRASRATEPLVLDHAQRRSCPPSSVIRSPADSPARVSSEPKYISAPTSWYSSMPGVEGHDRDLGVHGVLDRLRPRRPGSSSVVAMPSTSESTAFWISVACWPGLRVVGVLEVDAVVVGGLLGTGLDLVPEGVARRLVGDHRDGVAGVVPRATTSVLVALEVRAAAGHAAGGQEDCECGGREEQAPCSSSGQFHGGGSFPGGPEWPGADACLMRS